MNGTFQMTIAGVFRIHRRGTVVTGRVKRGTVHVGDLVEIQGQAGTVRTAVTGLEMFRRRIDEAVEGDTVGVFLQDVERDEIQSGDLVVGSASPFG